jgi:hypothetical protein
MPAATVAEYLAKLPPERAAQLRPVRAAINRALPKGYQEGIQYGMIGWYVPKSIYPGGYAANPKEPLPFASLAAQKNHNALYLMCVYGDGETAASFKKAWAKTGKKLDMGKSCVRFESADELALDVIASTIKSMTVKKYTAAVEKAVAARKKR